MTKEADLFGVSLFTADLFSFGFLYFPLYQQYVAGSRAFPPVYFVYDFMRSSRIIFLVQITTSKQDDGGAHDVLKRVRDYISSPCLFTIAVYDNVVAYYFTGIWYTVVPYYLSDRMLTNQNA